MEFVVRSRALENRSKPGSPADRVRLKIQHDVEPCRQKPHNVRTHCGTQTRRGTSIIIKARNLAGIEARQKLVLTDQDRLRGFGN